MGGRDLGGLMQKNWLCAEFDHVQLDLNHLKTGSGNRFFGGILLFFVLVGSPGVTGG